MVTSKSLWARINRPAGACAWACEGATRAPRGLAPAPISLAGKCGVACRDLCIRADEGSKRDSQRLGRRHLTGTRPVAYGRLCMAHGPWLQVVAFGHFLRKPDVCMVQLLHLVEGSCHLIYKESMMHRVSLST